ncbi:MAG: hypothetical protein CL398_05365, partial [Acidiferrobacteraceae bacterium]|nr:hypothetical protein [Acidiferrobacteraceae bacterium]
MSTKGIKFKKGTGADDQLITTEGSGNLEIKAGVGGKVTLGDDKLKFPDSDGTDGQVIKTDGAGNLSFGTGVAGGGEANAGNNLGSGEGIYTEVINENLQFKSLVEGSGIDITSNSTTITIAADGGGGGGSSTLDGLSDTEVTGSESGGEILIHDGSDSWDSKSVSGDIAISEEGVTTIQAGSVENSMLASGAVTNAKVASNAAIDPSKIATGYPAGNLSGTIANSQLANKTITITAGDGLDGSGTPELGQSVTLSVKTDNSTLEKYNDEVRVKDSGITNAKLANESVSITAGDGLTVTGGGTATLGGSAISLAVGVDDSTIEVNSSDKLQLKADGIKDTHIDFGTSSGQVSTADIPEQTNLYYTDARVQTKLDAHTPNTHSHALDDMTAPDAPVDFSGENIKDVGRIDIKEGDEPGDGTLGSNTGAIYAKSDGKIYFKNNDDNTYDLTAGAGSGSGSVTSVDVDEGNTGLTTSGGPVTTSGTITLGGTLNIASGGTGENTAQEAIDALTGVGDSGVSVGEVLTKASDGKAKWEAGGSALTVKESDGSPSVSNVSTIEFNNAAGFVVTDEGSGTAKVDLGSHWKELEVEGASNLIPDGEEDLAILKGDNITFSTDTSSATKSLTIGTTGLADAVHYHTLDSLTDTDFSGQTDAHIPVYDDATDKWENKLLSGDVTMTKEGVVTVVNDSHTHSTYAATSHNHSGADITSGDISLTGEISAGEFTADTGTGADDGLGFDGVGKQFAGVQYGNGQTGASTIRINSQDSVDINLDTNSNDANGQFGVYTGSTELFKVDESGVTTTTTFAGSGASLTNIPVAQLDGPVAISKGGTGEDTAQEAIDALTGVGDSSVSVGHVLTKASDGKAKWEAGGSGSFDPDGAQLFNESAAAVDFQIKGDTEDDLFYVDGSADAIGIGTNTPETFDSGILHIKGTTHQEGQVQFRNNGQIVGRLYPIGTASSPSLEFRTGGNYELLTMTGTEVIINDDSRSDIDFRVESENETHALFVDASTDGVGIKTTPNASAALHVKGTTWLEGETKFYSGSNLAARLFPAGANILKSTDAGGYSHIMMSGDGVTLNDNNKATFDLQVKGDTEDHLLFADAGTERVGVLNSSPTTELDVTGTVKATAFEGDGSALTNLPSGSSTLSGLSDTSIANTATGHALRMDSQGNWINDA